VVRTDFLEQDHDALARLVSDLYQYPAMPASAKPRSVRRFQWRLCKELLLVKNPIESAHFATAVAAISVTRNGAQPTVPTMA
jgi:ribokinase